MLKPTPKHCPDCNEILFRYAHASPGLKVFIHCKHCHKETIFTFKTSVACVVKPLIFILLVVLGSYLLNTYSGKPVLTEKQDLEYNLDR